MFVVPDIQGFRRHTQAAKRRHALVAQWIERPPPERKATSPILVEGTHENSVNHNARILSSLLSHAVAPRTVRASRGNALVAQRIERRFPKPGAAGPTPAMGTLHCQLSRLEHPAHNGKVVGSIPAQCTSAISLMVPALGKNGTVGQSRSLKPTRRKAPTHGDEYRAPVRCAPHHMAVAAKGASCEHGPRDAGDGVHGRPPP